MRAKLPLDPKAVAKANAAVRDLTDLPGRQLDASDPADAELRHKWMAAYQAAGGPVDNAPAEGPAAAIATSCPNPTWIELRYLHCGASPVKGAQWHIRSSSYNRDGTLNNDGFIRIEGVPQNVGTFLYWFDQDPEEYKPRGPAAVPDKTAAVSAFDSVIDWIWGTIQGDFNENASLSQIAVNTILGLIPLVDQALDIRDLIAGLKHIIDFYSESEEEQRKHSDVLGLPYEIWLWLGVFLIAIGCIPELGSAVKGVLKGIIHELQKVGKAMGELSPAQVRRIWEEALKILNHFGIQHGNAHQWLKKIPEHLDKWIEQAATKIDVAMKQLGHTLDRIESAARRIGGETASGIIDRVGKIRAALKKAYAGLERAKAAVNKWIREQIEKLVGARDPLKHEGLPHEPATKGSSSNTSKQEQIPPPEPDLALARYGKRVEKPGNHPDKFRSYKAKDDVPSHYRNDDRFDALSVDDAHKGDSKAVAGGRQEAMAGLEAEEQGLVKKRIERGPKDIEFYDGSGQPWDVKAPPSPPPGAKWKFKPDESGSSIAEQLKKECPNKITGKPEPVSVILDSSYMNEADHKALWDYLKANCTSEQLSRIQEINVRF